MILSAPLYRLRREAKKLARELRITLAEALDRVARREGYVRWSLLVKRVSNANPAEAAWRELAPGELVLVAARPQQGKTLFCLELAIAAMKAGHAAVFFTLEYQAADLLKLFEAAGEDPQAWANQLIFDDSDDLCANHIALTLADSAPGTVVVIDYLQLLDQKRSNSALAEQVASLRAFAHERRLVMLVLSQVDRRFESSAEVVPGPRDVRLPNPVDLALFSRAFFLGNGEIRLETLTA